MKYFVQYDDTGSVISIGVGNGDIEISETEYNSILSEIQAKASFVDKLYRNEITIDSVPSEWQEEIQNMVNERNRIEDQAQQFISSSDFQSMIEEVL